MKQLQFFKGLSWLLVLNLLIKPVWIFLVDRQVQNIVGHEAYGSYFALLNLGYVLLFIADAGLSNYSMQQIAAGNGIATRKLFHFKLILLAIYSAAACAVGWLTGVTQWNILLLVIFLQAASSLLLFLRGLLAGHQLFKLDAFSYVADKILVVIVAGIFLYGWLKPISIEIFLQIQVGATLIICIVLFFLLIGRKLLNSGSNLKTGNMLKQAAPFAAIILLMATHYRADGFLLERLNGPVQAGIYATAYRLLDAANMVGYLVASFLVPFVARNLNDAEAIRKVVRLYSNGLLVLGIFVACFGIVFASWIQSTLYHTNDLFNTQVIQLTIAVLPAYYLLHIYGSLLTAAASFKAFLSILLAAVIVNLTINSILIPAYGAKGSAIAAIVSQYFCALACYLAASKRFNLAVTIRSGLASLFLAAVVLFLLFLLQALIHSVWIILAVLLFLLCIVLTTQKKALISYVRSIIH